MWFGALILFCFAVWNLYLVFRAIRLGAYETLGKPVLRASQPTFFRFLFALRLIRAGLYVAVALAALRVIGATPLAWLIGCYFALEGAFLLATPRLRKELEASKMRNGAI